MKSILRIARIELSLLFYSPVAWIVLLVFWVQACWEYTAKLERLEQAQQMGMVIEALTDRVFTGYFGLLKSMKEYLYLYIPLLTMGLISKEINTGSIKLLYSSPIKVSEIVLGKYLAMVGYCFVLISVLLGLGMLSFFTIDNLDFSQLLSGIIGLYLLICAYSAIGLFMSSLTTYQVVAAISTLVVLAGLNFVGKLWQDIDFVRDITYFLSIAGRAEEFIAGLISSRDVSYFLIVIFLFVGLTYLKLQAERESAAIGLKMARYLGFIGLMLGVGYVSSRPTLIAYQDMTRYQDRTLTHNSQAIVGRIDGPVKMTTYVNLLDEQFGTAAPAFQISDLARFDKYIRFLPKMETRYVYYYDKVDNKPLYQQNPGLNEEALAKKVATAHKVPTDLFLTPTQIKKQIYLKSEGNRLVRVLEYNGKKTFLRMFDDIVRYPDEKEITAAFKRLVNKPVKVAFIDGHRERNLDKSGDADYRTTVNEQRFRASFINQGFDVSSLSLTRQSVPADVEILVIADPLMPFSPIEQERLRAYIDRGGNALFAGEPGQQAILNPLLAPLGVSMQNGIVVQKSKNFAADFVLSGLAKDNWIKTIGKSALLKRDSVLISMPGVASLAYQSTIAGFSASPLLVTRASDTWTLPGSAVDRRTELVDRRANEAKKSMVVALALQRNRPQGQQRIIVLGDADFMSNAEVARQSPSTVNFNVVTELFRWFSNGAFPIDITRPEPVDNRVLINSAQLGWLRIGLIGVLPSLLILSVASLLLIRKRR